MMRLMLAVSSVTCECGPGHGDCMVGYFGHSHSRDEEQGLTGIIRERSGLSSRGLTIACPTSPLLPAAPGSRIDVIRQWLLARSSDVRSWSARPSRSSRFCCRWSSGRSRGSSRRHHRRHRDRRRRDCRSATGCSSTEAAPALARPAQADVSYIFIGFVPVLLIIAFFLVSGMLLFFNVGAYMMRTQYRDARRPDAVPAPRRPRSRCSARETPAGCRDALARARPPPSALSDGVVALVPVRPSACRDARDRRRLASADRRRRAVGACAGARRRCPDWMPCACYAGLIDLRPASGPARRSCVRAVAGPTAPTMPSSSTCRSTRRSSARCASEIGIVHRGQLLAKPVRQRAQVGARSASVRASIGLGDAPGTAGLGDAVDSVDWDTAARSQLLAVSFGCRSARHLQPHLADRRSSRNRDFSWQLIARGSGRRRRAVPDHPGGGVLDGAGARALDHRVGARAVRRHRARAARRLHRHASRSDRATSSASWPSRSTR